MTKKEQAPMLPSAQHHSVHFDLAQTLSATMLETPDGEHMLQEAGKRALLIAVETDLTRFVMAQAGGLKVHASSVFGGSCNQLDSIAARAQAGASGEYVGQFHHLLKDQLANQLLDFDSEAGRQSKHQLTLPLPKEKPKSERSAIEHFFWGDE